MTWTPPVELSPREEIVEEGESFAHNQASLLALAEGVYPGTRTPQGGNRDPAPRVGVHATALPLHRGLPPAAPGASEEARGAPRGAHQGAAAPTEMPAKMASASDTENLTRPDPLSAACYLRPCGARLAPVAARLALPALALVASCGSRSGLWLGDGGAPPPPPDVAPADALSTDAPPARCPVRRTPADFDGDGVGDLAVATREGVRAYYGTRGRLVLRAGAVIPYPADVPADRAALAAVGDLDGDGTGELAVFARSAQTTPDLPSSPFRSGALYVVSGSRAGLVSGSARRVPAPPAVVDLFPSRVRAAGRLRGMAAGLLAVATHRGGGVALFERRGDGSFETVGGLLEARPGASNLFARGASDLDGDGFEDLALFHEGEALVYGGGADGASTARRQVLFADAANYVGPYLDGVGDVTGDGCPDLLLLRFGPDDGFILFAGGAGFGAGSPWAPAAPGGAALRVNGT